MPYVLGDSGNIAAILFADPLLYPPPNNPANKVLWVSRVSYGWGAPLHITATLADGSMTAHRVVEGGPGPSYLNLPASGCWDLTLRWGHHTDSLRLGVGARGSAKR